MGGCDVIVCRMSRLLSTFSVAKELVVFSLIILPPVCHYLTMCLLVSSWHVVTCTGNSYFYGGSITQISSLIIIIIIMSSFYINGNDSPHCHCVQIVKSYLPCAVHLYLHPILYVVLWAHSVLQVEGRIMIGSPFFRAHSHVLTHREQTMLCQDLCNNNLHLA